MPGAFRGVGAESSVLEPLGEGIVGLPTGFVSRSAGTPWATSRGGLAPLRGDQGMNLPGYQEGHERSS
ncbi:hypothetical protein CAAN1_30S00914 [[Candida] anglica]|uniref:Uncharacterized protein n=1 Tax=[Candida] anglica TaxID=148631 RepID=A0ABP0EIV9_9ASCO